MIQESWNVRDTFDALAEKVRVTSSKNPKLSKVLSFEPGVGQNIVLHSLPTARKSAFLIFAFSVHLTSFFPILFKTETSV